ncbi:MAG: bifunctional nicotinamidase/pyrazinamidase [Candidatus Saelkia tenebricola]|nr:bifunctional nicotinamidase/pyrazinamidase [Candidatus Saelkia tenebricola]
MQEKNVKNRKAFLIIDLQNDFCLGGALAVPQGDQIIPVLNECIRVFIQKKLPVLVTRDWHPEKSSHFKEFGGLWPAHCVQNTKGAQFHPQLQLPENTIIISGGMNPNEDGYSAFDGVDSKGVEFVQVLKDLNIEELYIGGLATDYCVKQSVLDAVKYGFKVNLLIDAIKGVNISPNDSKVAIKEMLNSGVSAITLDEMSKQF